MARSAIPYAERTTNAAFAKGFDPDVPEEGFYRTRLATGGLAVGVRIWFGPPHDPVTGEELDRSHRWQATANGEPINIERVWPRCAGNRITQAEAEHLARLQQWGRDTGHAAIADPSKPLDHLSTPVMF